VLTVAVCAATVGEGPVGRTVPTKVGVCAGKLQPDVNKRNASAPIVSPRDKIFIP
jgi:hypothetical protein